MAVPESVSSVRKISAYVPCYNNAATVSESIKSLKAQTVAIDEIFVIDDGSTDESVKIASACGVKVIENGLNSGRGAVRAQAMQMARNELVFCLDASKVIGPKYLEHALSWPLVGKQAGVFGRIILNNPIALPERWANRHIYEMTEGAANTHGLLVTAGSLLRKSIVLEVGNFNRLLRHSEDRELGHRLLQANYDVVFDPVLTILDARQKNLPDVLETYWRWHAGDKETVDFGAYLRQVIYSIKVLAARDIQSNDLAAVFVSLLSPHYQLWRSLTGSQKRRV